MLRISTRGRYALRAAVELAAHADDEPVLRRDIAERQGISANYVAQLFRPLCAAGLVEAIKGPGGGYRLARRPAMIRAGDVVRAAEGPIAVVECCLPEKALACERREGCPTRPLWMELSRIMTDYLDSVTLKDLCASPESLDPLAPGSSMERGG
jgi:Rrf2 family protein